MSWQGYITPEQRATLKVGDTLVRVAHLSPPELVKIESISPTGRIRVVGEVAAYNVDGTRRGDLGFSRAHLEVPTEIRLAEVHRAADLSFLRTFNHLNHWSRLSDESLHEVVELIKQHQQHPLTGSGSIP